MRSKIVGTGMFVPDRVVTNDDLAGMMDTSDEWIVQRTGIKERRWITEGQTPADLGTKATQQALERAGLEIGDIDLILLATLSPQHDFPGTSFFVHEQMGAGTIPCIDLRAQCSGFLYALSFADAMILAGKYQRVLVLGCEVHSTGLEKATRGRDVTVLFGDGAGALILEANREDEAGVIEVRLHAEGAHARRLWLECPSSSYEGRVSHEMLDEGRAFPSMDGRYVFKHAVTRMPEVLLETLDAAGTKVDDVDHFLFHQANLRINEFVADKLSIPPTRCFSNIARYGNCSAASIPMLLAELDGDGKLAPGDLICMTGFGSGFTWGSAVVRW